MRLVSRDEGTLNIPQSYEAKAEVYELMSIRNCTISEKNGTIVNGIIQDAPLGLYLMTQNEVIVKRSQWQNAIISVNREWIINSLMDRATQLDVNPYSGKVLASSLFPEDFNYKKVYDTNKYVEIVNGILVTGVLSKNVIADDEGSILQFLNKNYGAKIATEFQGNTYILVSSWMTDTSISFNYTDCDPGRAVEAKVRSIIQNADATIRSLGEANITGKLENNKYESIVSTKINSTKSLVDKQLLENTDLQVMLVDRSGTKNMIGAYATYARNRPGMNILLSGYGGRLYLPHDMMVSVTMNYNTKTAYYTTTDEQRHNIDVVDLISVTFQYKDSVSGVQNYTKFYHVQNSFMAMIESKSKGSFNQYAQVAAMAGQQSLNGKRIQRSLANNSVTLPHFEQNVRSMVSEGFVDYGYLHGIPPLQYYMHGIAARQSVIDTAANTPATGYQQRKATAFMQNSVTQFDGTVRSTSYVMTEPNGNKVVVGNRVESVTGNERMVGGPIVQFMYGDMGLATNKLININGSNTFTDIKNKLLQIRTRDANNQYAYVVFVDDANYKVAIVTVRGLKSLIATPNTDVIVVMKPTVPLSFQTAFRSIASKAIVSNYDSPLWAYSFTSYKRIIIIDGYYLLAAPISSAIVNGRQSVNLLSGDRTPTFFDRDVKTGAYNTLTEVMISTAHPSNDAMVIIEPSIIKYTYAVSSLDVDASEWYRYIPEIEQNSGINSAYIISNKYYDVPLCHVDSVDTSMRGYHFIPCRGKGILDVQEGANDVVGVWYRILNRVLDDYNYLNKYYY